MKGLENMSEKLVYQCHSITIRDKFYKVLAMFKIGENIYVMSDKGDPATARLYYQGSDYAEAKKIYEESLYPFLDVPEIVVEDTLKPASELASKLL